MSRIVVITGANRGIGLELVKNFLGSGDTVIATARQPESALDLIRLKEENPDRLSIEQLDVKSDAAGGVLAEKLKAHGLLDILVNNAGILKDGSVPLRELGLDSLREQFEVNTLGPLKLCQALLPFLEKSKEPVIASITSKMGSIDDNSGGSYYGYRMSKAALNMFNKSLSVDFPKVRSLVLHPGWVQTDMGGSNAPTTPAESGKGLFEVINNNNLSSGGFYDFTGKELPW